MPDIAFVSFGNLTNIRGMSFTFNRGITPSACTLYATPQDSFDPSPATLQFGLGAQQMQFTNCSVASCNLRKHWDQKWPVWAIQVLDRRWLWRYGSISGTYNTRIPNTAVLISAKDLMSKCLDAMNESGYDVSRAPQSVWPYVTWNAINPALALADLCDKCACEVVLNPLTDKVEIWPLGTGQSTPTNAGEVTPKWRFVPRSYVPSSIEAQGGPSLYQYRLLLEAVFRSTNLLQSHTNPDWTAGVNSLYESFNFPSITNTLGSELALATAWRQYRVVSQEGGSLNVPGLSVPVTNTRQYVLQNFILFTAFDDKTALYQQLDPYIEGDFWPFSDLPNNVTNQVYLGPFKFYPARNLVEFPYPVVKITSAGYNQAVLYLQVAYGVNDQYGNPVRVVRTGAVGGSGGKLVIRRPEVFAGYAATQNTEFQANSELDAYVAMFQQKYANPLASEMQYGGILRQGTLDGNVAQARWEIHPSKGPTTHVCEQEELDVYSVGQRERRRREHLGGMTE